MIQRLQYICDSTHYLSLTHRVSPLVSNMIELRQVTTSYYCYSGNKFNVTQRLGPILCARCLAVLMRGHNICFL